MKLAVSAAIVAIVSTKKGRIGRAAGLLLGSAALISPLLYSAQPMTSAAPSAPATVNHGPLDLPFNPQLAAVSCPYERGPVKEGSDADRFKVSTTVTATSIAYLRGSPKPSSYPRNNRIAPTELHTWQFTAILTQYKVESDGDIHLVLKDSAGRTMIAEIPYGACVPSSSRWRSAIAAARVTFTHVYSVSMSWHYVHRSITVKGLGMFDPPHGQTGVAPNGVELHPVTAVGFH